MEKFFCFNRARDFSLIQKEVLVWSGPFSWPGYEKTNFLEPIPDVSGVYLFTFEYHDGYIFRNVGITNSMKKRFYQHKREYYKGNYSILDVEAAQRGERKEIWHGWWYAKKNREEFFQNKEEIFLAIEKELGSYRLFLTEIQDKRKQERIEAAIALNAYLSKEPWGDLIDRGMALKVRYTYEIPIEVTNICPFKIYGLPEKLEI